MKRIAKFISGLLSASLAFNFAAPAVSEAMAAADKSIESMSEVVRAGLENFAPSIDISKFGLNPYEAEDLSRISEVIAYVIKMPDMFYTDIDLGNVTVNCTRLPETQEIIVSAINVVYNNTPEDVAPLKEELEAKVTEVVDKVVSDDMTELQKALSLHDYIVLNTVYDTTGEIPDLNKGASAYDVLVCGNGVCEGYAQAYNMLLDECGISSVMVTSVDMCHAWNLVNIDNEWYHVDTTWDDPVPDGKGRVNHKYFMLSDEELKKESDLRKPHYNWDSKGFEAVSDKYDNAFWSEVGTEIFLRGDKWYYVTNEGEYSTYTESAGEVNNFVSICDEKWQTWDNPIAYWTGKYASIIISDDKVYYNTPTMIYKMNLDGSCKEYVEYVNPYFTNGFVYGMVLKDSKLYAVIKQSPSDEGTLYEAVDLNKRSDVELGEDAYVVNPFLQSIAALRDGDSRVINWKEETETILPAAAIESIRGREVKLTFELNGYSWDIKGRNVTAEEAQDLNLEIKQDQGIIPEEMIQSVSHSKMFVELNLTHHGQFGLTANIRYAIGSEYANQPAILYYYNEAEATMEEIDFMMIDTNGDLNIDLNHASSYGVVLPNVKAPADPIISEQEKPPEVTTSATVTSEEPAVTTAATTKESAVTTAATTKESVVTTAATTKESVVTTAATTKESVVTTAATTKKSVVTTAATTKESVVTTAATTKKSVVTTAAATKESVVTTTTAIEAPQEITTSAETVTTIETTVKVNPDVLKGDVNLNGVVDISDLSVLALACLREVTLNDVQMEAADVTKDGKVGLTDLACMKQYLMNVITHF